MLVNIILLLFATTVFGDRLQVTPEELNVTLAKISDIIRSHQRAASQEIRATLVPLNFFVNDARQGYIASFKPAAKSYWNGIDELKTEATDMGIIDPSDCLDLGNEQLYALNHTLATEANAYFTKVANDAENEINQAFSVIGSTLSGLDSISEKVYKCRDNTCATILEKELVEYHKNATEIIDNATTTIIAYVFDKVPKILGDYTLDVEKYQESYTPFLAEVKECISKHN